MNDLYGVIKKPCLTEKGTTLQEAHNQIVLEVAPQANKIEIRQAVEKMFNVKVDQVRTLNMHGKKKRMGRHQGKRPDWKKAVVTLAEGHTVDFLEGL
ncbi:MAG: 50S ribosomal protein L23 [Deltaproteobacteria bacterium]